MISVKKMLRPLKRGKDYVYPPTVMSQVHADDNLDKTMDQITVRKDLDVLTLEEIEASTNLEGKVPSAEAFSRLNSELSSIGISVRTPQITGGIILNGGYIKIGKAVIVSINFKSNIQNPLITLPKPMTSIRVESFCMETLDWHDGFINNTYSVYDIPHLTVGNTYFMTCAYIAE